MKRFGVGAVVGAGVVVAEVRVVEGVGVVVGFEEVGGEFAESLSCVFGSCPVGGGGGDDAGSTGRGQRAVLLSGVEGGEWMGCFSVADVKAIVGAIRGCIEFHNARMADQVKEGFRAW